MHPFPDGEFAAGPLGTVRDHRARRLIRSGGGMRHMFLFRAALLLVALLARGRAEGQTPSSIRDAVIGETGKPTAEISTTELLRVLADLRNQGYTGLTFTVEVLPELKRLLRENPNYLEELDTLDFSTLSFDFYIQAAVTPLSTPEYLDYQRGQALLLRNRILEDSAAQSCCRRADGGREMAVQVSRDDARVKRIGGGRRAGEPPRELAGEQMVGQLGLTVHTV